jgi:rod shape-determining protein MreC
MYGVIRNYIPWLLTTSFSLILIFSNNIPQVDALRVKVSDLFVTVSYPISGIGKVARLWRENRDLRQRLATMNMKLAALEASGSECERLRWMLNYKSQVPYGLNVAMVVGMSPDPSVRGVLVNAGSDDGVAINQAAIAPDGIVGRVYRVGNSSSAIQFITDMNIGVAGRLLLSRESGIIHSTSNGKMTLDGIPVTATVEVGDTVVTAGLDGIFPSGLNIGIVEKVNYLNSGWLLEIEINPSANFNRLEELFIIVRGDSGQ